MPCRELRFCLWYFMWSTKIRKTVFVQKVAKIKRKHPKSEDFRCCSGAADQIRTGDLILTNGTKLKLRHIVSSIIVFPFTTQITYPLATFYKWHYFFVFLVVT